MKKLTVYKSIGFVCSALRWGGKGLSVAGKVFADACEYLKKITDQKIQEAETEQTEEDATDAVVD